MSKATRASGAAYMSALPLFSARIVGAFNRHLMHRRDAYLLSQLDDSMLKDIGLTRADVTSTTHRRNKRHD